MSEPVTNEEQELLALVFLFRPVEKNRLVKNVLLEKEERRVFSGAFKAKDHDVFDVRWQG